jgi:hypothetical protein
LLRQLPQTHHQLLQIVFVGVSTLGLSYFNNDLLSFFHFVYNPSISKVFIQMTNFSKQIFDEIPIGISHLFSVKKLHWRLFGVADSGFPHSILVFFPLI